MPAKQQDPAEWLTGLNDRPELKPLFTEAAARLLDVIRTLPAATGGEDAFQVSLSPAGREGRLNIVHRGSGLVLSDVVPLLENAGLRVKNQAVWQLEGQAVEQFEVEAATGDLPEGEAAEAWSRALASLLAQEAPDDALNGLLLRTGLDLRQLALLRAYAMYRAQIDLETGTDFLHATLVRHPRAAEALWNFFDARFNPEGGADLDARRSRLDGLREEFLGTLADVSSLREDRSLRGLLNLLEATVRTNYYQGHDRISFKLRSAAVDGLPEPRPLFEIGVNAASMSGTHLRGGLVARGGIRWSDRPLDFRSEVLGLLKTQTTKNAVIVPVGSKGGFTVRGAPSDRDAQRAFVQDQYREYVRGLLDITDNQKDGEIIGPDNVVAWDEPDPYLVVAADKGTATFSDIANATAAEYGFWLGDAFASGGSHGYDHKGVGITARGAWQTVSRHFRELGIDVKKDTFTAAGIGDMAGDVFGNGMLYTDRIRLQAAFNHLHIFLDPEPDAERGYAERQRLFLTPGSSWADYGASLISEGGGVFERSAKAIPLSQQVKAMLQVDADELSGEELIRAVLRMPVDLLWNGGIGTYVKAESESHRDVQDSANDAVRVNGSELRARVVGEGGNLGFTQLGRIEYALNGGLNNTDAIDNSGGVDLSDHEVNIKIMFQGALADGRLDFEERNRLLEEIAEDVTQLVLHDNYTQSLSLSLSQREAARDTGLYADLQAHLALGALDEKVEFLPDAAELESRAQAGKGYTRPELAVLLAYAKMDLYARLLASDLPGEPEFAGWLLSYFPEALQERFREYIENHSLSREITATLFTNRLVDLLGSAFVFRLVRETGRDAADVSRCALLALAALGADEFSEAVFALDNKVTAERQYALFEQLRAAVEQLVTRALAGGGEVPAAEAEKLAAELRAAVDSAGASGEGL